MATTSKRISQLPLYTNQQFNPLWMTCVIPANFAALDTPEYPDTFKVPLSTLVNSLKDVSMNGQLTVLKTVSAACPVIIGTTTNRSGIFIYRGFSQTNTVTVLSQDTNAQQLLTIGVGKSWFFKVFIIGVNSSNQSTSIEFIGLIRRNSLGTVELVGTPTKIIHSRNDITTDAFVEDDNSDLRSIKISAKGSSYNWTARLDIVEV
jgi:hypothetical protein